MGCQEIYENKFNVYIESSIVQAGDLSDSHHLQHLELLNVHDVERDDIVTTLYDKSSNLVGFFQTELVQMMYQSLPFDDSARTPGRYFNVHTKNDFVTLGPVGAITHTESVIIVKNESSSLIGLFPTKDVQALYLAEIVADVDEQALLRDVVDPLQLAPVESLPDVPNGLTYQTRINPHTKGYELVGVNPNRADKGAETSHETSADSLKYIVLTHQNLRVVALYDTYTGTVLAEKGSHMYRRTASSLKHSAFDKATYRKRTEIIKHYADFYNGEFYKLKEDVEFSNISEASIVLLGSIEGERVWHDLEDESVVIS